MPNRNNNRQGRIDEEFKKEISSKIGRASCRERVFGLV